jgi:hypothetical protein
MRDPFAPSPDDRKKFMFYDTEKRQADLRIRLKYDGFSQSSFFRAMITGYLDKDESLLSFLEKHKIKYGFQGQDKIKSSNRITKKGKQIIKQFALNEEDIEDIFDLIKEENPDL